MHKILPILFLSFFLCETTDTKNYTEMQFVKISVMDKISGEIKHITAFVGKPFAYKRLRGIIRKCFRMKTNDTMQRIVCYIEIYDIPSFASTAKLVFSNWLFSDSPAVNMFEHPLFDIAILPY